MEKENKEKKQIGTFQMIMLGVAIVFLFSISLRAISESSGYGKTQSAESRKDFYDDYFDFLISKYKEGYYPFCKRQSFNSPALRYYDRKDFCQCASYSISRTIVKDMKSKNIKGMNSYTDREIAEIEFASGIYCIGIMSGELDPPNKREYRKYFND